MEKHRNNEENNFTQALLSSLTTNPTSIVFTQIRWKLMLSPLICTASSHISILKQADRHASSYTQESYLVNDTVRKLMWWRVVQLEDIVGETANWWALALDKPNTKLAVTKIHSCIAAFKALGRKLIIPFEFFLCYYYYHLITILLQWCQFTAHQLIWLCSKIKVSLSNDKWNTINRFKIKWN